MIVPEGRPILARRFNGGKPTDSRVFVPEGRSIILLIDRWEDFPHSFHHSRTIQAGAGFLTTMERPSGTDKNTGTGLTKSSGFKLRSPTPAWERELHNTGHTLRCPHLFHPVLKHGAMLTKPVETGSCPASLLDRAWSHRHAIHGVVGIAPDRDVWTERH